MIVSIVDHEIVQERKALLEELLKLLFHVFLTDGRANIAKDGSPGRPKAMADAQQSARSASLRSFKSLWIDTSPQARDEGKAMAALLGSMYLPLPNAGVNEVSQAIMQGLKKTRPLS